MTSGTTNLESALLICEPDWLKKLHRTEPDLFNQLKLKIFLKNYQKYIFYNVIEAQNIFNTDETGFQCEAGKIKIVCNKYSCDYRK